MATILDGRALAAQHCAALEKQARAMTARGEPQVGLGVVLVGDDAASAVYVRNKERRATAMGLRSQVVRLSATATQAEVMAAVAAMNADPGVHAFLVQLPLPPHLDADAVVAAISPHKDADGLHPDNVGRLCCQMEGPRPCTPAAVMALLAAGPAVRPGDHAVVIGRSNIVGRPLALMLLERHATVTVCHSRSVDLRAEVMRADIVVAAVGRAELVRGAWIKPGATVIDVGINRVDGRLVGDVEFAAAAARAGAITPVPGGVGPMTIAMLLHNTVRAARRAGALTDGVAQR